jgi:hypothetical protein
MNKADTKKPKARCLGCGELFERNRADKKFCTEACKTAFHNDKRNETPQIGGKEQKYAWRFDAYRKINSIILRNRNIMDDLMHKNIHRLSKHDLIGYGFNFKYFTSAYDDPEVGASYRFCYEWGYRFDGPDSVELVPRFDEIRC